MKKLYLLIIMISIFSCKNNKSEVISKQEKPQQKQHVIKDFQTIIDSANVEGAILIYNLSKNTYYSNDFKWIKKGFLPASTFKIPNSIIALESGLVKNDSTLFTWNGEKRGMKVWEQDLTFKQAFHFSCVPCYQDIARKIGVKRMKNYVKKLNYGNLKIDSTSIAMFWLEGTSHINQLQQIDFLKRFYASELPISRNTETIMKRMMLIEETETYKISGKTGWSIRKGNNNGWFVGYVESESNVYFFATNIVPKKDFNMNMFPLIRKEITYKALKKLI